LATPDITSKKLFETNFFFYVILIIHNQKLKVVSAIPHTHLTGTEVWTKIIRKGVDIGYLFRNKYYDFNYQNSYNLDPPVKITKDDSLYTYCGYQTLGRSKFTAAGLSTKDEVKFILKFYILIKKFQTEYLDRCATNF
jgi:hypothetical protein